MNCGRLDCTGIHDTHRPYADWCDTTKERQRERAAKLRQTPGTYEFGKSRGIGQAGEVRRVSQRRQGQTPGFFVYDRNHGIGRPGLSVRMRERKHATARDEATLEALVAAIEGSTYGTPD